MTKRGMRGFAAGLFLAAALMAYVHYTGNNVEETMAKRPEITTSQVEKYLESKGKVAVDADTYNELQASTEKGAKKKKSAKNKSEQKEDKEKQSIYNATIDIREGMSSQEIIANLKKAKVIESEDKLFDYLDKNNLLQKVQIGTYKLDSTMSIQEIAKKIT